MEMFTQNTLFFMMILSVSAQSNITSTPSTSIASTPTPSSSAAGSVSVTPPTSQIAPVATSAVINTNGAQTALTPSTTLSSNLAMISSYTGTGAGTASATTGATTTSTGAAVPTQSPSATTTSISPSSTPVPPFLSESTSLPSASMSFSASVQPSVSSSSSTTSASCNTTSEPLTCTTKTCCTGNEGAWTGVNKAASVTVNQTVQCDNGTNTFVPKEESCEKACIKKECDGASAIVVGHVFAACLTFAVFWIIME